MRAIATLKQRWKFIRRLRSVPVVRRRKAEGIAPARPSRAFWVTFALAWGYLAIAATLLWQWNASAAGGAAPWARFDLFNIAFFVVSAVVLVQTIGFGRTVLRSTDVMNEFTGITYDPQLVFLVPTLGAAEMLVFLDYGHWRLTPALEHPLLRGAGLVLYVAAAFFFLWTDRRLHGQFVGDLNGRTLITNGPFRFIRHPRHASLIASRFAFALIFASVFGWVLSFAWLALFLRRIHLEEPHLYKIFGADYEAYARRTARLIPGIY